MSFPIASSPNHSACSTDENLFTTFLPPRTKLDGVFGNVIFLSLSPLEPSVDACVGDPMVSNVL